MATTNIALALSTLRSFKPTVEENLTPTLIQKEIPKKPNTKTQLFVEYGTNNVLSEEENNNLLYLDDPEESNSDSEIPVETNIIEETLSEIGVPGTVINIKHGPIITRYEIKLKELTKVNKLETNFKAICLGLQTNQIRIITHIPGTNLIGIEVVNNTRTLIPLKPIMEKVLSGENKILPIGLGVDPVGVPKIIDLTTAPHILVAGTTGSGKSVCLNNIILSLTLNKSPDECKLILIDPKRVEMAPYRGIPHLATPIVTEPKLAEAVFQETINVMEGRFKKLEAAGVRNISSYEGTDMPYIVIIVDEMADLMMTAGKNLEDYIVRIAQKARAVGIHLILATQKPSADVFTTLIRSNMPSRIAFRVSSSQDSRIILDNNGAECLAGKGDMLYVGPGSSTPERYHGAWVSDEEIENTVNLVLL